MVVATRSLSRDRNFMIFWVGQGTAALAESFVLIAVPLLVLDLTGSVARMGLVSAMFGLGRLTAGVVAGAVVDRVDRRKLMIRCDIGRAALYALIPIVWLLFGPQLWLIYLVVYVASIMAMFFEVTYITAIGNLVDRDQIIDANGRLHATFAAALAIGPSLAGLSAHQVGAQNAIGLITLFYLGSALSLSRIRFRRATARRIHDAERLTGKALFGGLLIGGRIIWRDPLFRALTMLVGAIALFGTGVLDLFIFYLKTDLGQSEFAVGIIFGVASAGSFIGGVIAPKLRRRHGYGPVFAAGFLIQGAAILAIGVAPAAVFVAAFGIAYLFGESIRGILTMTLRQEVTPDHLLGRVTAAFWMAFNIPGPIGAALITAFGERTSASTALMLVGVITITLGCLTFLTPVRDRHPEVAASERFAGYAAELEPDERSARRANSLQPTAMTSDLPDV